MSREARFLLAVNEEILRARAKFPGQEREVPLTGWLAYKLPLGDVECDCWSCGRPVHTSELTFAFAEGAIRWIHRGCRSRSRLGAQAEYE